MVRHITSNLRKAIGPMQARLKQYIANCPVLNSSTVKRKETTKTYSLLKDQLQENIDNQISIASLEERHAWWLALIN